VKTLNEWLKNNFYSWFAIATVLDLLLLFWIALKR